MDGESHHVLFDINSFIVLAIHKNLAAISITSQATEDTSYAPDFTDLLPPQQTRIWPFSLLSTHPPDEFNISSTNILTYPEWTWVGPPIALRRTNPAILTDELRAKSRLAQAQCIMLDWVMKKISRTRARLLTGIDFQELVHVEKKRQALAFKDLGFDPARAIEFPYVADYAGFAHISLERAAYDIILKAQLADDLLRKTDLLRMTFFRKVLAARDPSQMKSIMNEFMRATARDALA